MLTWRERAKTAFKMEATTVTNDAMISPVADHLLIGGASIIAFFIYWLFVDAASGKSGVAEAAFWLTFVINSPHFLSSYLLLYGSNRKLLFKKPSFIWAGFVAPALLIGILVYGAKTTNVHLLGLMAQGMYLSVGWHYVKQIFGTAVVASAIQKRYFGPVERNLILLNLYSIWGVSWVFSNIQKTSKTLDGLNYYTLALSPTLLTIAYVAVVVTLLAALFVGVRKYIDTGVRPATSALVSFAAIYFWFVPSLYHPHFAIMIPFFHSLQYMLFVVTLRKNQVASEALKLESAQRQRARFVWGFWGFIVLTVILGALSFEFIPNTLDRFAPFHAESLGKTFWLFSIAIFINIHHYFIDNVIWRGDNELLKKHLVLASQKARLQ